MDANSILFRPPNEWTTGGAPMTDRQSRKIFAMARLNGMQIRFVDWHLPPDPSQKVTKAEASILITMLEDGLHPSWEYIDSLGRSLIQYSPPPHPRHWQNCHDQPTDMQLAWIAHLGAILGVPADTVSTQVAGITLGQAALLIERLKEEKDQQFQFEDGPMLFARTLEKVLAELPLPRRRFPDAVKQEAEVKLEEGPAAVHYAFP
ncbi:hypothetical protein C2E23DRAFT_740526 [Lenzites betulinus]|nr:hypothetical protein C2E23DRAFT_740526 [Lenzites betulinus]